MRYRFSECCLDVATRSLSRAGEAVAVEPQVFDLLHMLVEHADRVVTRDEIIARVWGGRIVSDSAISARIAAARKAVGCDGKSQKVIRTVTRRGLQLAVPVTLGAADTDPDPAARMEPPTVRYTRNDVGRMLAYTLFGDGPPLLLTSFFSRSVEGEWRVPTRRRMLTALAGQHRVACYDEIGAGLSDPDMSDTSYASKAEDARAVADAAGFDRFSVFAESGGALNAIRLAAEYPERVQRMVISGGYAEGHARRGGAPEADFIRAMIAAGWDDAHSAHTRAYLTAYCPDGPAEAALHVAEMMRSATPRRNMLRQRDLQNEASVVDLLEAVRCPVLIIHARHDSVHPLSGAQTMASRIPGAALQVLESSNHLPMDGSALFAPYLAQVLGFLAGDALP